MCVQDVCAQPRIEQLTNNRRNFSSQLQSTMSMQPNSRKIRRRNRQYSHDELVNAYQEIVEEHMPVKRVAKFNIPHITVRDRLSGKVHPDTITTAPHIGHLYSSLLADAAARYHRLQGTPVLFSTGTDEHGMKIQQAATKANQNPLEFATAISETFKNMFDNYDLTYSDYIRTTEQRHYKVVKHLWKILEANGYIYKGKYEGWYSVSDESFLGPANVEDKQLSDGTVIKVSCESGHPVVWMEEENYMFKLSEFKDEIVKWIDSGGVQPEKFGHDVKAMLQDDLQDLSVTRQSSRLNWGIPVPGDESHTIYVWLDALANYLTVAGFPYTESVWPADCHVIGKDILKFHAVYWPAFLLAAGLDLPKKVFCHSHWMVDGVKMSKSLGNVIDPMEMKTKYTSDVFRYCLLRDGVPHADGNFTEEKLINGVNSDIVNTLGNLLSRCTGLIINPEQVFPQKNDDIYLSKVNASDRETFENMEVLIETVEQNFSELTFYKGIFSVRSYLQWANGLFAATEPWVLVKTGNEIDKAHVKTILHMCLETLRISGILLQPIVPTLSDRLLNRLGIPNDSRLIEHAKKPYLNSPTQLPLGPDEGLLLKRLEWIKS